MATTGGSTVSSDEPLEVTIGVITSTTGPAASVGLAHQHSLEVAEDVINADPETYLGGASRSLHFDFRDVPPDVPPATTIAQTLADDADVLALVGPTTTPQTLAIAPLAQQLQIPFVNPTSPAPGITDPGKFVFKLATGNDVIAEVLVPHVLDNYEVTKAGVIYSPDNQANLVAGEQYKAQLGDAGIDVTEATLPFASNDYAQILSRFESDGVDTIFIATNAGGIVSAVNEAERNGYDPLWAAGPMMGDPQVYPGVADTGLAERLVFATEFDPTLDTPLTVDFRTRYQSAAGTGVDQYATNGMTAGLVIAAAVKSISGGEITREQLAEALAGLTEVNVPAGSGTLSMNEKREGLVTPAIFTYGADGSLERQS